MGARYFICVPNVWHRLAKDTFNELKNLLPDTNFLSAQCWALYKPVTLATDQQGCSITQPLSNEEAKTLSVLPQVARLIMGGAKFGT